MKEVVTVIVEKASDGGYACFVKEEFDGFGLAGYGDTAKEAIADLSICYQEMKELMAEEGKTVPEMEFVYQYDLQSFFNYFSFLNISKVGELAKINPSLLRQYASGTANAGQKQYDKIRNAINHIIRDLSVAQI
ncbi:MAG: pilus assembly protein HicB [Alistipes timonensis]|nr:pilus assembly protein HicB [Alistipes timonensis]